MPTSDRRARDRETSSRPTFSLVIGELTRSAERVPAEKPQGSERPRTLIGASAACAPARLLPLQVMPDQLAPDQLAPLQVAPAQLAPLQEEPLQVEPFQVPPDQLEPAASSFAIAAELNGLPKMSFSPCRTTPLAAV